MLIILGGRPGSGKTSLARALALRLGAVHLRIDSIEQALRRAGDTDIGAAGYAVGQALAADNLRLGRMVIADSVNPVAASRQGWRDAAAAGGQGYIEIELTCSDAAEYRRRIETRQPDIAGHVLPDWAAVQQRSYEPWSPDLVIDTAQQDIAAAVALIEEAVSAGTVKR